MSKYGFGQSDDAAEEESPVDRKTRLIQAAVAAIAEEIETAVLDVLGDYAMTYGPNPHTIVRGEGTDSISWVLCNGDGVSSGVAVHIRPYYVNDQYSGSSRSNLAVSLRDNPITITVRKGHQGNIRALTQVLAEQTHYSVEAVTPWSGAYTRRDNSTVVQSGEHCLFSYQGDKDGTIDRSPLTR